MVNKKLTGLISIGLLMAVLLASPGFPALAAPPPQAPTCAGDYTVQAGDSISLIAQKYFGDVLAYTVIIEATNTAAETDSQYSAVTDPNMIEPGKVLCIPPGGEAQALLTRQLTAPPSPPPNRAPAHSGSQSISFSHDSTVTRLPIVLTLQNNVEGVIRYTTNGAFPDANSTPYTGPIPINQSMVIRAQVFNNGGAPVGDIHTKSYILAGYDQTIPVMSIVGDWMDLELLQNNPRERGEAWEKPINIEYFVPGGEVQFNVKAGIRIHGGFSRMYSPKKSYRLYFRKEYGGPGKLDYPLFPDTPVHQFDKLVLRAGFQDTFHYLNIPDHSNTPRVTAKYVGDQVVRNLHRDMGQPIAHGAWVLLYLNGQFWGLYNLTERIDLQYFESYAGENSQWDIITKDNGWDNEGN